MIKLTREDFQRAISEARKNDEAYTPTPFRFGIPNAKETLIAGLEEVMRHKTEWLSEYDQITGWLTDNQGKGLLLIGPPGVGKSEICMKVIPMIFEWHFTKSFPVTKQQNFVTKQHIIILCVSDSLPLTISALKGLFMIMVIPTSFFPKSLMA